MGLPAKAWRTITWRQGTNEKLTSRFVRVRVRAAHRDYWQTTRRLEEWLLIEWPKGEDQPTKYWLSTLSADVAFRTLVETAKLRWRIERDYQELKQEVGLGHFEGRGWRGFHHHATTCIVADGFLISKRETIPPQALGAPGRSRSIAFPQITDPADLPLRTQRHIPNSTATMRRRLEHALVRTLSGCPCCAIKFDH
ncbi:hypothetical protein WN73_11215 [Bradyrhizobium sp. CCBAU 45394]|nr:hypothetical protein [Bradyrhizobium sp. CCBAU 45394]